MASYSPPNQDSRVTLEGMTKWLILRVDEDNKASFDYHRNWGSANLICYFNCNKKNCRYSEREVIRLSHCYHQTITYECPKCKEKGIQSSVQFTVCDLSPRRLSDSEDGFGEMEIAKVQVNQKGARLRQWRIMERVHTLFQGRNETKNVENQHARLVMRPCT